MASVCDICGKGPGFGNRVSFSHRRTPRRFNPNLQVVHAKVDGTSRRMRVCTSTPKIVNSVAELYARDDARTYYATPIHH